MHHLRLPKKLLALVAPLVVVGALFAVPAMASANVTLTNATTNSPLGLGETVEGTSTDIKTVTSLGTLECEEVNINGEITANGGETAEAENGGGTANNCNAGAAPVIITNISIPALVWFDDGSDLAEMNFLYDVIVDAEGHFIECELGGVVETAFTFNTNEDEVLPSEITGGGDPGCPASGTISGTFLLHQGADEVVFK